MDGNAGPPVDTEHSATGARSSLVTARRLRLLAVLLGIAIAAIFLVRFLAHRAAYVATADARIASDMVAVSTDISGKITEVAVGEE